MQIKALIVALFAGIAMAMPTDPPKHGGGGGSTPPPTGGDGGSGGGKYDPCQGSGAYNNAQCCATDILGLANLDCAPREFSLLLSYFLPELSSHGRQEAQNCIDLFSPIYNSR